VIEMPMVEGLAADVADQPAAFERLARAYGPGGTDAERLAAAARHLAGRTVALVGSGASHAACVAAAASWRLVGLAVEAPEAGEFLHYDPRLDDPGLGVVVVTYSGQSAEAVAIAARRHDARAPTILVTEGTDSSLATSCALALPLHCGVERATATKSFTNTLGLLLRLGDAVAARGEPNRLEVIARAMTPTMAAVDGAVAPWVEAFIAAPGPLDIVGRGPGFGTALFGGLVLRELLGWRAGWMTAGHFRHGPLLDVGSGHRLIITAGRRALELSLGLARDAAARGASVLLIADGNAATAPGIVPIPIHAPDEGAFAILAALPGEGTMARAARTVGTRYVRVQATRE